jgi:hypothetical protein
MHALLRELQGHEARCVGAALAATFGDCFGQPFENKAAAQVGCWWSCCRRATAGDVPTACRRCPPPNI